MLFLSFFISLNDSTTLFLQTPQLSKTAYQFTPQIRCLIYFSSSPWLNGSHTLSVPTTLVAIISESVPRDNGGMVPTLDTYLGTCLCLLIIVHLWASQITFPLTVWVENDGCWANWFTFCKELGIYATETLILFKTHLIEFFKLYA